MTSPFFRIRRSTDNFALLQHTDQMHWQNYTTDERQQFIYIFCDIFSFFLSQNDIKHLNTRAQTHSHNYTTETQVVLLYAEGEIYRKKI